MTTTQKNALKDAIRYHGAQKRNDGKMYISHPIAVYEILKLYQAPSYVCLAGFLHDVIEDTSMTLEILKEKYGDDIAWLVDGVTHYKEGETKEEHFERMFTYAQHDANVIILKMADRLHNVEEFETLKEHKKEAFFNETQDFMASCVQFFYNHSDFNEYNLYKVLLFCLFNEGEKVRFKYGYKKNGLPLD